MTESQRIKERVAAWGRAAPTLEELRRSDIRQLETKTAIAAFDGLVMASIKRMPPVPDSGLVEQQKWFSKLAKS